MAVPVYFASPRQSRLRAEETLPAKLDIIIDRLGIKDRVNRKSVAIKMHLGANIGYSTIHPVFVRKLVSAVKEGGGRPFLADTAHSAITAYERGYAHETVGCPILPCAGIQEREYYAFDYPYKNVKQWKLGSILLDADFLIGFAHVKGHPSCGVGGAIKNLALGAAIAETRSAMHDTVHFDPYWFPEKLPEGATIEKIMAACRVDGIVRDRQDPNNIHLHYENCNQCMDCKRVAGDALEIRASNFYAFQEACAISTMHTLSRFEPENRTFINIAVQMTPVCDCFGFTGLPVLPDVGIFGSDDILAVEKATLDVIGRYQVIEENLPLSMIPQRGDDLHPFQVIHGRYKDPYKAIEFGQALGLGSTEYELIDVMPLESPLRLTEEEMRVSAREL